MQNGNETKGANILTKSCVVKQYIAEALFKFTEKKNLRSVAVNELVKTAGVCRFYFYRNFLLFKSIVDEYYKNTSNDIFIGCPMTENYMQLAVKQFLWKLNCGKTNSKL